METWAWLLAYVVGFGLLQFALYHHFRRNDATPDSAARAAEGGGQHSVEGTSAPAVDEPGLRCQHCGTRNEHIATVRYCRECISPLR